MWREDEGDAATEPEQPSTLPSATTFVQLELTNAGGELPAQKEPDPMPDWQHGPFGISVVIVNWNSRGDLSDCLHSLRVQTDTAFETIVVDNGSTDGSVELVREQFPEVQLIATGANLGFAEGCNRGIEASNRAWVATLNNDAVADPRWIEQLRGAARTAAAHLGMIQSKIVFKQRQNRTNSTGVLMFRDGSAMDRDYDAPVRADDAPEEVFCASAGAALYRRSMLEETRLATGFFDRTFFMYFEDVDLGWRCRLAGWSAMYAPAAVVYHAFHGSADRHGSNFVFHQCYKNRIRCVLKNGSLRFILGASAKNIGDIVHVVLEGGVRLLPEFAKAARDGARQRKRVASLVTVDRNLVERRWMDRSM